MGEPGPMPLWLFIPWVVAMNVAVWWQPRWMRRVSERLFESLANFIDRLFGLCADWPVLAVEAVRRRWGR